MSRLIKVFEPLEIKGGTEREVYRVCIARVDNNDYSRINKYKWFLRRNTKTGRVIEVYRKTGLNNQSKTSLGREVLRKPIGSGGRVLHVNNQVLDCRKCNLRLSTPL